MFFSELQPGQKITLQVRMGDNTLLFDSYVQEILTKKNAVLADAIMRDEKPISFRANGVIVDVIVYFEDNKPLIFKNVDIRLFRKGGQYVYYMTTIVEGVQFNRRENFRCYIGVNVNVQFGLNSKVHSCILKDVSSTGFALVCDPDVPLDEGRLIHTVLNDQPKANGTTYNFHLYGLVARTQELENGKLLVGCRLNNPVAGLDKYIMEKERLRLQSTPGRL